MSRAKVPYSLNPLQSPTTPIQALASRFGDFMHFPDPAPLYCLMGAVAANMLTGPPVWLMLVGPPSCGGSRLLSSLNKVPYVYEADSLRGPAALLSGTSKRERSKTSSGGLLRRMVDPNTGKGRGGLIISDFTSVLGLPSQHLDELLGNMRRIYDGSWHRDVGSDGGQVVSWEGRIGVFSKCTQVIDRHQSTMNEMGERLVYYRYPETSGYGECWRAASIQDPDEVRRDMQEVVAGFFDGLGCGFDNPQLRAQLDAGEVNRMIAVASFAAKSRSGVHRNNWTREIEDVPQSENPTRLATILGQLYSGMKLIGVEETERWRVVRKVGMDCMPKVRSKALEGLIDMGDGGKVGVSPGKIQELMQVSNKTVERVLGDLKCHGVVEKDGQGWVVSKWGREQLEIGWGML